ncbi:HK97 gp10 family phage protein [Diplocloster modestus]|uniref:HK97 gp10 family phage protein n=1 Tax=Diplocloster modestus TaxID=2850322 RepID=A0ABS6K0R4_9FIRM|nr:HK97 gp10 family phage protein [Diplocloster modestus]MBU9724438.1 HK97 gp10 family phage protein [Diplocloster modestus]
MINGKLDLDKKFDHLSKIDLTPAVKTGIMIVQEAAKSGCPVHDGELREKIMTDVEDRDDIVRGFCWPAVEHGVYVELGTGPRGQENHEGISLDIAVAYTQSPWWIHESQIDKETAEQYHWFYIDTSSGRFYQCAGQPAQPYLYPALKDNEEGIVSEISKILRKEIRKQI